MPATILSPYEQPQVAIVGAGPGDPDLLTIKAFRYIKGCDILMYDSLFGNEILELVPGHIEKIYVGKTYGDHQDQSARLEKINQLFYKSWQEGKKVVRLKTGNPLIFSRGSEEIHFLISKNIPFEIVPGITSAMAGACESGISLTQRFNSSAIVLTTGFLAKEQIFPLHLYFEFLREGGCMVIYMGLKLLEKTCELLEKEGFGSELKFIVASNISTDKKKVFEGDLTNITDVSKEAETPAIIYVGKNVKTFNSL